MRANYITTILKLKRSVYQTILTLSEIERSSETSKSTAYEPLRKRRRGDICIDNIDDPKLRAQFRAAHKKIAEDEETVNNRKKEIEEENIATARAFELKDVSECQCCFDTYSNAKIVICNGEEPHTFCMECLQGHIKAQLDLQKHEICCMDASGCEAAFSRSSKKKAVDDTTFERLERVQQQNELRTAGLPLTECPFCEFAAICPPVEVDREFRCQRVDCQIISCRLCNQKSHLPLTCEEHKKEQGVDQRHQIEEEMTKAYLRMCPKCKIPIVKEGGCNKITCSRCRSHICDVCGKDITKEGYKHFGRQCPQADATFGTERAVQRVKAAETSARQQVLSENPDLSAKDLEIVESEAVKRKAEAALNNGPWIGGHIDAVHANLLPHRQVGIIRRGVIHDRMVPQQIHPPALMPFQPPPATDWGRTAHGIMYPGFPLPNAGYGVAHPQPDVYQQPTAPTYHQPFQMVAPLNMHPHEGYATSRPLVPNQFPQGTLPMQQFMPTAWQPPAQQRLPNLGQPIWNGMSEADLLTRQNVILQQQAHMQQWQIQTGARIHQQVQERLQQQRNAIRTRPGMGE